MSHRDHTLLPAAGGKRGALTGGALTAEVLDSSPTVLATSRGGATVGLQQYFTPREAAELIVAVNGRHDSTLDLTAGDGSLLAGVTRACRFGVEIDADHIGDTYEAIHGDLRHVGPLLQLAGARWPRVACNPPFGLKWNIDGHYESSTLATWRLAVSLLLPTGAGAFIAGRDRFLDEVLTRPDAAGVYALIECPDLFADVQLPCVIAFFVHPANVVNPREDGPIRLFSRRDELAPLAKDLIAERARFAGFVTSARGECHYRASLLDRFAVVRRELERRRGRAADRAQAHDIALVAGRLSVRPSPFARLALHERQALRKVERLHRQPPSYFALNLRDWRQLEALARDNVVTIAPDLADTVAEATRVAELTLCPLYPLPPQMRLGFLDDLDHIRCVRSDPERGFEAGHTYPLATRSDLVTTSDERPHHTRDGRVELRRYDREAKVLRIEIGEHRFNESRADIDYLLEHFDIPDPGCLGSRYPKEVGAARAVLQDLADRHGFQFMRSREGDWQLQDLARLLVKGSGELCWEQGGGKSLGGLALIHGQWERGAQRAALVIAPQDLIPQWQEQARKFFGRELTHITTPAQARAVARHLRSGGEGLYITHYEALSLVGRVDEPLPEVPLHVPIHQRGEKLVITSATCCPACHAHHLDGWQKRSRHVCEACGYVHKRLRVKTAAHYLAHAFRNGVIVVDEGTLAKGHDSLRSKALRGMRARHRYLMTGTPISNYVNDAFWLLWWTRGDSSLLFPYAYNGGRAKFEEDFCVIEWRNMLGRRDGRRVLPQITNLSRFWRLMASGMIRRRKHQMGDLPPRTIRTIAAPMGVAQKALYKHWLSTNNFRRYFRYAHPDSELGDDMIERHAAALGQLAKLEYATTLPEADPAHDWPRLAGLEASNWTPKNLKVLQVALDHVRRGEKVLIGSGLIETGRWLCEQLQDKGVNAAHIVEQRAGRATTMSPRRRARVIHDFKHGDIQVLCCGIPSIRLGHSLETASCVIVDGLVWSHEMFDQFIARAWRLTSPGPVTVYIALTLESLDPRRWDLLRQKAQAADLALDGHLVDEPEQPISREKFLRELKRQGVRTTGDEIPEADVRAAWEATPALAGPSTHTRAPDTPALRGRPWHELRIDGPVEQLTFFTD